jgi:hypothetical protein
MPRILGLTVEAASSGVYMRGVQCVEMVEEGSRAQCLKVAMGNIDGCPPHFSAFGRLATDAPAPVPSREYRPDPREDDGERRDL